MTGGIFLTKKWGKVFRITLSRVYEPAREYHDFIYTQLNEAAAAPAMEFRGDFP